jgi:hypothetical protein
VALLAAASVAFGAFVMPALRRESPPPAAQAKPSPLPERAATPQPAGDSLPAPAAVAPLPADEPAALPATGLSRGPSPFDTPAVPPRLPSTKGAYALSRLIDAEVGRALQEARLPLSPPAGDAEFLRRVSLDLTGKVPTRERAVAFLRSEDPTKRAQLVDELLASPDHGVFFARLWADLLVKRDFDTNRGLKTDGFVTWLAEQFNSNAGWDQTVRAMVTASGPEESKPETFFLLANQDNRQPSPAKLVGAVGNLFMGVQIQCAECHQHPFNARWGQNDFWGMAAFFAHTKANRAGGTKKKPTGPAVITEVEQPAAPRTRKGKKAEPALVAGLRINVPDPNDPRKVVRVATGRFFEGGAPPARGKAPYRPLLASWLTAPTNRYFARATVNRVWAHFFARGLVHPVEEMGGPNKPTHPALLRSLAEELADARYDLKKLMRAVCNSEAYQRTSRPVGANKDDEKLLSHMPVKVLSARQLLDSLEVVTGRRAPRPRVQAAVRKLAFRTGGDPLVRSLDTREYDDDVTEFSYGIPQLLRLMNTQLTSAPAGVARQIAAKHKGDPAGAVEDVYLTALSRRPTAAETARMVAYVRKQPDAAAGLADVTWALLNCAEFVSNH